MIITVELLYAVAWRKIFIMTLSIASQLSWFETRFRRCVNLKTSVLWWSRLSNTKVSNARIANLYINMTSNFETSIMNWSFTLKHLQWMSIDWFSHICLICSTSSIRSSIDEFSNMIFSTMTKKSISKTTSLFVCMYTNRNARIRSIFLFTMTLTLHHWSLIFLSKS